MSVAGKKNVNFDDVASLGLSHIGLNLLLCRFSKGCDT